MRTGVVVAGLWTLWAVGCALQVWLSMLSHGHSLTRIVGYEIAVWEAWVPPTFAIAALVRRWPLTPARPVRMGGHLVLAAATGVAHQAWLVACMLAIRPYDRMNPAEFLDPFATTVSRQLPLEIALYAVVALATEFRERDRRAADLERSLAEARRLALERQLQPHFLFNTLNTVSALIRCGQPAEAVAVVGHLADLLRYATDRTGDVPLEDEIAVIGAFLEVHRARFPDRLTVAVDLATDARGGRVPALIVQPLAENAVRHGIARHAGPGRIEVRAWKDGDRLRIEVHDTGTLDPDAAFGVGLCNTADRLRAAYGDQHRLELRPDRGGTTARIELPWTTG